MGSINIQSKCNEHVAGSDITIVRVGIPRITFEKTVVIIFGVQYNSIDQSINYLVEIKNENSYYAKH